MIIIVAKELEEMIIDYVLAPNPSFHLKSLVF